MHTIGWDQGLRRIPALVVAALVSGGALAGCGDDGSASSGDLSGDESSAVDEGSDAGTGNDEAQSDAASGGDPAGGIGRTNVVVTVDGTTYAIDTDLGGHCEVDGETETGGNISVGGFDDQSGTRVELSLRYQIGETTASGEDEYFGSLSVASSPVGWSTSSTEPWPFAIVDPVASALVMEDDGGRAVDVTFEIDCAGAGGAS